jgi:apolipoprotein D and lipocalin family protein
MITPMRWIPCVIGALTAAALIACSQNAKVALPPLETVPLKVDLNRYVGKWYEIARYENSFQKNCVATTATYSMRPDGNIRVLNQCRISSPDGELKSAEGKSWITENTTNAKLKVSFFWPFSGDYWIIELGENYDYAVIGHPGRKYLWILSRTPQMNEELYKHIIERLAMKHSYDTSLLIRTLQPR